MRTGSAFAIPEDAINVVAIVTSTYRSGTFRILPPRKDRQRRLRCNSQSYPPHSRRPMRAAPVGRSLNDPGLEVSDPPLAVLLNHCHSLSGGRAGSEAHDYRVGSARNRSDGSDSDA